MEITVLSSSNLSIWMKLRKQLWPHHSENENKADGEKIIMAEHLVSFIALDKHEKGLGFADASIRYDYVNGCIHSPVAFLEGLFIIPSHRGRGFAKQLVNAAQSWGAEKGCTELASDTALDNLVSQKVHTSLGFKETEKVVFFKKDISQY